MTKYQVIDDALLQIAQGDQVFVIDENGEVDLPTNVALDLLSAGQIEKVSEGKHAADAKSPGKPKGKPKGKDKAGADPEGNEDADAADTGRG
jgi:hypothetical protein